jgi:hypothetical protein
MDEEKKDANYKAVTLRLDIKIYNKILELADLGYRSTAKQIQLIFKEWFERQKP